MKCSPAFWGLTLTLKASLGVEGEVLKFFHFGSPTQRCPHSSSPWHIASWKGASAHENVFCDHWELGKTQNVCEQKFLEGTTPDAN